ncbi:MAG: glycerate kinase [Cyclobacteriaceae bacterium]|nr:glycerate kinase [Cyclobacteriaceae bacterium]
MTIVVAPDKFKGSLTSKQVCAAIKESLLEIDPSLTIISIPLADGGEGTSDLLTELSHGTIVKIKALDPLFRVTETEYGISADGRTAFIEMAKISGLLLLKPEERNPMLTTTFGTGQLIKHAMERGVEEIVLGIGGSATNDAGIGMAEALGFSFLDENGIALKPTGENLIRISSIIKENTHPLLSKTRFTVLCDVDNYLHGPNGAAYIFGKQKGGNESSLRILDEGLLNFQKIAERTFSKEADFSGAGAAGGLGSGAKLFLNARLSRGFHFISTFTKLEDAIAEADLVITGEGKIDHQTLSGKVVQGVAGIAQFYDKPCVAFAGKNDLSLTELSKLGIEKVITLSNQASDDENAMSNAFSVLKDRAHLLREFLV